jgi:hypothetical protein
MKERFMGLLVGLLLAAGVYLTMFVNKPIGVGVLTIAGGLYVYCCFFLISNKTNSQKN